MIVFSINLPFLDVLYLILSTWLFARFSLGVHTWTTSQLYKQKCKAIRERQNNFPLISSKRVIFTDCSRISEVQYSSISSYRLTRDHLSPTFTVNTMLSMIISEIHVQTCLPMPFTEKKNEKRGMWNNLNAQPSYGHGTNQCQSGDTHHLPLFRDPTYFVRLSPIMSWHMGTQSWGSVVNCFVSAGATAVLYYAVMLDVV